MTSFTTLEVTGVALILFTAFAAIGIFVVPQPTSLLGTVSYHLHSFFGLVGRCLEWLLPSSLVRSVQSAGHYLLYEPNRVFQSLYFVLMLGGYSLYLVYTQPLLPLSLAHHDYVAVIVILWCVTSYVWLCNTSPGLVTADSVAHYQSVYPYDGVLYKPGTECPTCHLVKPARSKHCSVCGCCFAKMDHHCIWINGCVGANNHRHFLLFLYTHVAFTGYAVYVLYHCLYFAVVDSPHYRHFPSNRIFYAQYIAFYHQVPLGLLVLALMLCIMLGFFTGYHSYLALTNQTTNERSKVDDYISGRNIHLHWELIPLVKQEESLKGQLRVIQRKLLVCEPSLRQQHRQWTTTLINDSTSTDTDSDSEAMSAMTDDERKKFVASLFAQQDALIEQMKAIHSQMQTMQENDDDASKHGHRRQWVSNPWDRGTKGNLAQLLWPSQPRAGKSTAGHGEQTGHGKKDR